MIRPRILLIEDDVNLGYVLQENLELRDFEVTRCGDGEEGKTAFLQKNFDVCLIDIMLPNKDGFALAREIRAIDQQIPIIFLTAKSLKEDRIEGFKIGGDDYVTKPFSMEELILRIQAILKRSLDGRVDTNADSVFEIGRYEFDYQHQMLRNADTRQKLTHKEAELLRLLCLHQNTILQRDLALNLIWGDNSFFNARSMDVFVSKLRKYLNQDPRIKIVNVHGKGFKMLVE